MQTSFANGMNPWAGLNVPNTPRTAKEKPLEPRLPRARVPVEKQARGEKTGNSVIPLSVAHALIADLREYMRVKEEYEKLRPAVLARKYGLNENTVANIVYGESWAHISGFPRRVRQSKAKGKK